MLQIKSVEKIETHVSYSKTSFFRAMNKIMWKNMVESDKQAMAARRMLFVFCITKATVTQSEYALRIALPQQQQFNERV
jgi:predicted transcriptional regulator